MKWAIDALKKLIREREYYRDNVSMPRFGIMVIDEEVKELKAAIKILEESEVKMALTNEQRNAKMDDRRKHGSALQILRDALPGDICEADQESIMKSIEDLEELSLPDNIIISRTHYQTIGKQQTQLMDALDIMKKALKVLLTLDI